MKLFVSSPARWLAMLACLFTVTLAQAQDDGTDHSVTIEKDIRHTVVAADGTYTFTQDLVLRINEDRAIKVRAQHPLHYNRTQETLEVKEAYTLKADGSKVAVNAEQIREQQEPASAQAPMFFDSLVKVVIFPDVAVGDRLVLSYKKQRTTALFPGQFEDINFPELHPVDRFTLIYDLPADLALQADAKGFKASSPKAAAGRKVYQWDYQPSAQPRREQGSIAYSDYGQYLAVSTFKDYASFARAYAQRANVEVTPAIRELALSLTAKADSPRAKALVLGDWVRKNIRYVAVYIGSGSVVPHAAQTVLDNRYGDCKDHVALLEALLKAVDIDSTPALVNLGSAHQLPKVPTLGVLNHAINYIPRLDLYLDSTAEPIAAGFLPITVLDKPTVLTASATLGRTPGVQLSKVENLTTFRIDAKGGASFEHNSNVEGWAAEFNRWGLRSMQPSDRDLLVQRILSAYGQSGSGKVEVSGLDEISPRFDMKFVGTTSNLVNFPGPIGVPTLTSFAGGIAQNVFGIVSEKERSQPFTCIAGLTEEHSRFEFPAGVQIIALPKPVTLKAAQLDYSSAYQQEGNTVIITRRFDFHQPGAVCSPEDFKAMKPTVEAMIRDLNSQVIVQQG